jgi:hypothetical protein
LIQTNGVNPNDLLTRLKDRLISHLICVTYPTTTKLDSIQNIMIYYTRVNEESASKKISLSLVVYLRHYKIQLEEYLNKGMEHFDFKNITMPDRTKRRIEEEIKRIDLVITTFHNYKESMKEIAENEMD